MKIDREDMLELTRRMTVSRNCFSRIAGAYMDEEGFIDGTFHTNFLKLSASEKAKNLEELYQKQIEQADDEISQLKAKAALEAEQSADEQLKSAKKQAEKMLADAQDGARKEREKILVQTQQDIAKLAAVATQKLVMESMDDVYDQFLRAAEGGGVNESHRQ